MGECLKRINCMDTLLALHIPFWLKFWLCALPQPIWVDDRLQFNPCCATASTQGRNKRPLDKRKWCPAEEAPVLEADKQLWVGQEHPGTEWSKIQREEDSGWKPAQGLFREADLKKKKKSVIPRDILVWKIFVRLKSHSFSNFTLLKF